MFWINKIVKREEVMDVLRKEKFESLTFTETKLKGNGEVSWCEVNGIITSTQEIERAREIIDVFMNDMWPNEFGYVSSRTLWVKFKC